MPFKMRLSIVVIINMLIVVNVCGEECARPPQLLQFEETCFQEHSGFIERVQQKATSLFASAKKRLGFADNDEQNNADQKPKNCNYYQCIFNKMEVNNHHGIPDKQKLNEKYPSALPANDALIQKCFAMPENIETVLHRDEESFDVINAGNTKTTVKEARDTMNEVICEINSQVHRCLSLALRDTKCALFVFP